MLRWGIAKISLQTTILKECIFYRNFTIFLHLLQFQGDKFDSKNNNNESDFIFLLLKNIYFQVSGSKFWQVERSCMCCQEMGEREASIGIFCPKATPRFRKIVTRAPVECMCRPCTAVDESAIKPQEVAMMVAAAESELMGDMPVLEEFHLVTDMQHSGKEIPVI